MTKSHVSMEQKVCEVCRQRFDTGALLIDKRLRQSLERHTVTGWGLCPTHQAMFDQGYVALVECDPVESGLGAHQKHMRPEQAQPTGRIAHLKREVFAKVFDVPLTGGMAVCFIDQQVMDWLMSKAPKPTKH